MKKQKLTAQQRADLQASDARMCQFRLRLGKNTHPTRKRPLFPPSSRACPLPPPPHLQSSVLQPVAVASNAGPINMPNQAGLELTGAVKDNKESISI